MVITISLKQVKTGIKVRTITLNQMKTGVQERSGIPVWLGARLARATTWCPAATH